MGRAESALGVNVVDELGRLAARRMRMLRLANGWSAEQLSQKYGEGGVGSLTRATIAKIESDNRQIKAGEVAGVAKVFGLTSADLLDQDWPDVFLSYAGQDGAHAREIAAWLAGHGFRVHSAGRPAVDQPRPGAAERQVIDTAQAFVVLLSPNFLSSPWCREELDLAMRREQQLRSAGLAAGFIYVLGIAETRDRDNSALQAYDVIDLARSRKEAGLSKLGGDIVLSARARPAQPGPDLNVPTVQGSLDRGEELQRVLYGLNNPAGPHFWLVISPPRMGKTWFLERLTAGAASSAARWDTVTVDLRSEADDCRHDAMTVVRRLFGVASAPSPGSGDDHVGLAQKVIRNDKPWLCLLDSAELLPPATITQVRRHLGQIYGLVQQARAGEVRLGFVVASRLNDGWKGLTPSPGPSVLPLDGFQPAAIQAALERLALDMSRAHSPEVLRQDAALVQRVSEGVPPLVLQSLTWIRHEEWLEVKRLDRPPVSTGIISPYVEDWLLAPDSLLPGEQARSEEATRQLAALRAALRALVPFRFFTRSHVDHQLRADRSFGDALETAGWQVENLWRALAGMTLLRRPLDEPWHEIHPAIRRLLYRDFYPTPDERVAAHLAAGKFTENWASKLTGKDQVTGMVESIWHAAARLKASKDVAIGEDLTTYARERSLKIGSSADRKTEPREGSSAYRKAELRDYAAQRMRNDDELQREVADVPGLFEELVQAVLDPKASGGLT